MIASQLMERGLGEVEANQIAFSEKVEYYKSQRNTGFGLVALGVLIA